MSSSSEAKLLTLGSKCSWLRQWALSSIDRGVLRGINDHKDVGNARRCWGFQSSPLLPALYQMTRLAMPHHHGGESDLMVLRLRHSQSPTQTDERNLRWRLYAAREWVARELLLDSYGTNTEQSIYVYSNALYMGLITISKHCHLFNHIPFVSLDYF